MITVASVADGARFDMATCLLNGDINATWGDVLIPQGYTMPEEEFWTVAIKKVKSIFPNFKLIAEAYWSYDEILATGFDYAYDMDGLYTSLVSKDENLIRDYIKNVSCNCSNYPQNFSLCTGTHFISNHDLYMAPVVFGSE